MTQVVGWKRWDMHLDYLNELLWDNCAAYFDILYCDFHKCPTNIKGALSVNK